MKTHRALVILALALITVATLAAPLLAARPPATPTPD